jgi:hypothetical protein
MKKSTIGDKELSTWWESQTIKIRKEVLKSARFSSGDIKDYKLAKQSIASLREGGWGTEAILKARLSLGY